MKNGLNLCLLAFMAFGPGCADPVREDQLSEAGPEDPDIPPGPTHRAGQRCVGPCHDGSGPGGWVFSQAGTIYQYADDPTPLGGAVVHFVDSEKNTYATETNCAGNFFVQTVDFTPVYPAWMYLDYGGVIVPMNTPIFREGSCAGCHADLPGRASAGRAYFAAKAFPFPNVSCP